MNNAFPFAAIVGQDDMKLAMIMTAIDPKIGGVLVFGDRGTGKSTAVRGLANLLPPINSVEGCPVNSRSLDEVPSWSESTSKKIVEIPMPVVDLPLGIGSDRVTGALDIEKALVDGVKSFQPGLLAKANRGYLYIDEVNLLEDHIVDLRMNILNEYVDYFVISESNKTHQGKDKKINFNINNFPKFKHKIIFVVAEYEQVINFQKHTGGESPIEQHQRNSLINGLKIAHQDDLIILFRLR